MKETGGQHLAYNDRMAVKDRVFTPLGGVTLKKGLFKTVYDHNGRFLKQFRFEDMLYWFDEKLGRDNGGKPYRGHFEDNLKGQTASQYLMGAGNALRWADDPELHEGIDKILDKLEECEEPDGFMMPITKYEFADHEYPHYTRIWLNYGLIAAALAGHERAWAMLRRWQDWFNRCPDLPVIRYTNLAFQGIVGSTCMLQTPVYVPEDTEVARKYYEEDWRLAQFMQKERDSIHRRFQPGYEPHPHGTEIEALEGYLDLYRATGAPYYLKAVLGARALYKEDWQHPGGGIVMCEFLDAAPGCGWISNRYPYNELCCSAFWIHLNQRLHRLFPDVEEYTAEVEKSIYNIAIANQDGDQRIRYFAHLEGTKDKGGTVTCCCGMGTRIYGMLPEYLYSISEDSLCVNIYEPSEIEWRREGGTVRLETQTEMPSDGRVRLRLSMERETAFTLSIRMPGWMTGDAEILVNGEMAATGQKGTYLKLHRLWKDGDEIGFTLPMAFRATRYTGREQVELFDRYSFERGPLLYAVTGEITNFRTTWVRQDPEKVESWARPTADKAVFEIEGDPGHRLEPYYRLDDETPMTCFPIFASSGSGYR